MKSLHQSGYSYGSQDEQSAENSTRKQHFFQKPHFLVEKNLRCIKSESPGKFSLSRASLQYPGRESNPHGRNDHRILSPACLPVPPPGREVQCQYQSKTSDKLKTDSVTETDSYYFIPELIIRQPENLLFHK